MAAGVLTDPAGRVLIAQRPPGKHAAGSWEFPGGKLNEGESPAEALARELDEELGVTVVAATPFLTCRHDYPERSVELHVFLVGTYLGEPRSAEGQPLRWVPVGELAASGLLEADLPIASALASRGWAWLVSRSSGGSGRPG